MSNYRTIKFKKCEQEVYLNRIKSPLFALRSILFMLRRYSHRMLYRLLPTHILYPPAIRQAWSIAGLHKNYPLGAEKIMKNTVPTKGGLLLATGKWEFPGGNQWFLKYDDEEDLAVLSRWNWLLTGWTSNPKEMNETQGWALVRSRCITGWCGE